ncbi:MAG: mechanosensitive ion channel family protein [Euryarchaeota archaeon]|nr:mechanosensitive ion channel family protein [Euryarchaeota archaeon]
MYIIWLIGTMIALGAVGVEITPLITGMGIAGLAIALPPIICFQTCSEE